MTTSQAGGVLVHPPGSSQILNGSKQTNINAPIALDKKTRHVFHVKEMSEQRQYVVIKSDIDNPSQSEEVNNNKHYLIMLIICFLLLYLNTLIHVDM